MKERFTKGPWVSGDVVGLGIEIKKRNSIESICNIEKYDPDNTGFNVCNEVQANANLIACAPDMYEEIKRDIECLTRWIDNHGDAFPMTATWKDMRASKIELLERARG